MNAVEALAKTSGSDFAILIGTSLVAATAACPGYEPMQVDTHIAHAKSRWPVYFQTMRWEPNGPTRIAAIPI